MKLCECGCKTPTKKRRDVFNRFIKGHNIRIKNPSMKGKTPWWVIKGSLNPVYLPGVIEKISNSNKQNGTYKLTAKRMKENHPFRNAISLQKFILNNPVKNHNVRHKISETLKYKYKTKQIIHHQLGKKNPIASERMKRDNPAKYCRNPSKPQLKLFKEKGKIYGIDNVFLNYKIAKTNGGFYYLDVAVPSTMKDFEYDGYWHQFHIEQDKIRDEYLTSLGWNVIRMR